MNKAVAPKSTMVASCGIVARNDSPSAWIAAYFPAGGVRDLKQASEDCVSRILHGQSEPQLPMSTAVCSVFRDLKLFAAPSPLPMELAALCTHLESQFELFCGSNFESLFSELLVSSQADRLLLLFLRWQHDRRFTQKPPCTASSSSSARGGGGGILHLPRRRMTFHAFSSVLGCNYFVKFLASVDSLETILPRQLMCSSEMKAVARKIIPMLARRCLRRAACQVTGVLFHPAIVAARQWAATDDGLRAVQEFEMLTNGFGGDKTSIVGVGDALHDLDISNVSTSISSFLSGVNKALVEQAPAKLTTATPATNRAKPLPLKQPVTVRKIPVRRARRRASPSSSSDSSSDESSSSSSSSSSEASSAAATRQRRQTLRKKKASRMEETALLVTAGTPAGFKVSPTVQEILRRPHAVKRGPVKRQ